MKIAESITLCDNQLTTETSVIGGYLEYKNAHAEAAPLLPTPTSLQHKKTVVGAYRIRSASVWRGKCEAVRQVIGRKHKTGPTRALR